MTSKEFNKVVEEQLELCKNVLGVKAGEYADTTNDDRLHNFKIAAGLQGRDPKDALFGMLTKHLVSVRDMCYSSRSYDIDLWNEKITDSINYFLLLRGIVEEDMITDKLLKAPMGVYTPAPSYCCTTGASPEDIQKTTITCEN